MAQKIEGTLFQVRFDFPGKWASKTSTSGTDSQAGRWNFFMGMYPPAIPQAEQAAIEPQARRG